MSIFDEIQKNILAKFSEWIKVDDPQSKWTIEDFPSGVEEEATYPHCWRCVTVNKCWFKNKEGKKPEYFDYGRYSYKEITKSKRGMYHPNCHCEENAINVPKLIDIQIMELRNKFNNFFKRKKGLLYGIGYTNKDEGEIINFYINQVKESFRRGDYFKFRHWEYGFQINIIITINGKGQYKNEWHNFKTGLFIYPDGKLKIVTIFAGGIE